MKILSKKTIDHLLKKKLKISVAESCTGGLLSSSITSIDGSSKVFSLGLVSYSNESKIKVLKVPKKIIKKYGSVSEQVCRSMAKNISEIGNSKMSVSITGIAGPSGGSTKKPVRRAINLVLRNICLRIKNVHIYKKLLLINV